MILEYYKVVALIAINNKKLVPTYSLTLYISIKAL